MEVPLCEENWDLWFVFQDLITVDRSMTFVHSQSLEQKKN